MVRPVSEGDSARRALNIHTQKAALEQQSMVQRAAFEQQKEQISENMAQLKPGEVVTTIHDGLVVFVDEAQHITPANWEEIKNATCVPTLSMSTFPELNIPLKLILGADKKLATVSCDVIDKARDFIAGIQAKDEEHRRNVRANWVVKPEPQYVHTTCGNLSVVVRIRQVTWVRDERELFCTHCNVVPHELNVVFE